MIWSETAERNFGFFTYAKKTRNFGGNLLIWHSKKTEVPFCSFSPEVIFYNASDVFSKLGLAKPRAANLKSILRKLEIAFKMSSSAFAKRDNLKFSLSKKMFY